MCPSASRPPAHRKVQRRRVPPKSSLAAKTPPQNDLRRRPSGLTRRSAMHLVPVIDESRFNSLFRLEVGGGGLLALEGEAERGAEPLEGVVSGRGKADLELEVVTAGNAAGRAASGANGGGD